MKGLLLSIMLLTLTGCNTSTPLRGSALQGWESTALAHGTQHLDPKAVQNVSSLFFLANGAISNHFGNPKQVRWRDEEYVDSRR